MRYLKMILLFFLLLIVFILWKNNSVPKNRGVIDKKLAPCSWTPNCVNSNAKKAPYKIEPLPYVSDNVLELIQNYLRDHYNAKVMNQNSDYLYVVVTTPYLRFKDDLEFLVDRDKKLVSVRSASRVGYSDLNMNRKRIEQLRQYLESKINERKESIPK